MSERHYILATAGHIDHGKTTLVKALTGADTDRLPEEKARGITIELGFAELTLPHSNDPEIHCRIGVVDVPGHEDFVRNMVGGVSQVDLALIVVAADDGWMPQTEEHAQILHYLRARRTLIALTKVDLADDPEFVEAMIRDELAQSPHEAAPILPVSATTGQGIDALRAAISEQLSTLEPSRDYGKPRLGVDRTFSQPGRGAVVTGTLTGGSLHVDQTVVAHPKRGEARVRGMQQHNRVIERAAPGSRVALNLSHIELAHRKDGADAGLRRGDVITLPEAVRLTDCVDVWLERSPRLKASQYARPVALRHGLNLRAHWLSTSAEARLILDSRRDRVEPGEACLARLKLSRPLCILTGDRFILRDSSQSTTLAGGWILDPCAGRESLRAPAVQAFLASRAENPDAPNAWIAARVAKESTIDRADLALETPLSDDALQRALDALHGAGVLRFLGRALIAEAGLADRVLEAMARLVDSGHATRPELPGTEVTLLRQKAMEVGAHPDAVEAFLSALRSHGFESERQYWRRVGFEPRLSPSVKREADAIRHLLSTTPFEPKNRERLHENPDRQKALRFLVDTGEVTRLNEEVFLLTATIQLLRIRVKAHLKVHGRATSPELRDLVGASRKFLIPLLEFFDEEGLTRRDGDWRVLNP